ncbi:S-layer homology domain-containing protein [Leptothoe sp. LEGE 181152]|uniref:S-layer homology domain-containing protein n=1 Tax=Adonisia turfae CCMR0081 TaxID=2292702 RepID=A0A6M0RS21_9CYAN|nr:S-layer homology domain-containing protein [Leptothoe sp. LEGE 181152]NEZ58919.1 S-layer homology domain-containing protein [Adonisia turfae CCMR0081]
MSQIPSDPGTDNNRRRSVDYDELIALFVAFLTLGSVLFWGLTRSGVNLLGQAGLFNADSAPSVAGAFDAGERLGRAEDTDSSLEAETDGDGIGFGTVEDIGSGSAGVLRNSNQALERAAEDPFLKGPSLNNRVTSQTTTVPSRSDIQTSASTELPQQSAQPAQTDTAAAPTNQEPLESSREALQFQDVPDDYWAKPYIDALSERLVLDGISEGTFAPEQPVTRAQLASAIAQAFPLEDQEAAIAFLDVEEGYWATEAIDKAVKGGFMSGFPDESFQPTLPVPRAQVLTALVTGLNSTIPTDTQTIVNLYSDAAEIPSWAIDKMAAATQANIVVNYPNLDMLNPNQPATRAEVAAMIYQTLANQGRVDSIDGEYVVQP